MRIKSTGKRNQRTDNPFRAILHLIFLGVGLGVIAGSTLKTLAVNQRLGVLYLPSWLSLEKVSSITKNNGKYIKKKTNVYAIPYSQLESNPSGKEISSLSNSWLKLASRNTDLEASGFVFFLHDGKYAELKSEAILPAASSIKIHILLLTLMMVDSGELAWNEPLVLTKESLAGEAGWMAYQPIGTTFPIHEIAKEMIRVSDNTATNILINRMGGLEELNEKFKSLGLVNTKLNNFLPDIQGTNTSSTKDLVRTIAMVETGEVLTKTTRDLFRQIMSTSITNRLLPGGLQKGLNLKGSDPDYNLLLEGYRVLNKTGDIGITYADAALIEMPNNDKAIAAFIVKGPFNDPRSAELIRSMAAKLAPILKEKSNFKKLKM